MAKKQNAKKPQGKKFVKTQGKKSQQKRKLPPVSADDLDRQLLSYMGDNANKAALDDQLTTYFKTSSAN